MPNPMLDTLLNDMHLWRLSGPSARTWTGVLRRLRKISRDHPRIASPVTIVGGSAHDRVYHMTLGHGPVHDVVEVNAHAGELLWFWLVPVWAEYVCHHPETISGRTIHILLSNEADIRYNLKAWGENSLKLLEWESQLRRFRLTTEWWASILGHYRHPVLSRNACWSFPRHDGVFTGPVLAGAQAAIELTDGIYQSGERIRLWHPGHNMVVGNGVQFTGSGPDQSVACELKEQLALRLEFKLDTSPADSSGQKRHPATRASWTYDDAECYGANENPQLVGSNIRDYLRGVDEATVVSGVEVDQFTLRPGSQEVLITDPRKAAAAAKWVAGPIREWSARAIELAHQLESAGTSDRLTSAAIGLGEVWDSGWGRVPPDDSRALSFDEAAKVHVLGPMFAARNAAPALQMMLAHEPQARAMAPADYDEIVGMLLHALKMPLYLWRDYIEWQNFGDIAALLAGSFAIDTLSPAELDHYREKGVNVKG